LAVGVKVDESPGGVWFQRKPNLKAPDRLDPGVAGIEVSPGLLEDVVEGGKGCRKGLTG
jgi:hypothetical protein